MHLGLRVLQCEYLVYEVDYRSKQKPVSNRLALRFPDFTLLLIDPFLEGFLEIVAGLQGGVVLFYPKELVQAAPMLLSEFAVGRFLLFEGRICR